MRKATQQIYCYNYVMFAVIVVVVVDFLRSSFDSAFATRRGFHDIGLYGRHANVVAMPGDSDFIPIHRMNPIRIRTIMALMWPIVSEKKIEIEMREQQQMIAYFDWLGSDTLLDLLEMSMNGKRSMVYFYTTRKSLMCCVIADWTADASARPPMANPCAPLHVDKD